MCDRIVKSLLCFSILLVMGCAGPLVSSVGYYGPTPGPQKVKGSYDQAVKTIDADYDAEDVKKAVIQGAGIIGLTFDVVNDNMLSGTTRWAPPGSEYIANLVYAVYISKIGKRETRITIVVDHLSFAGGGAHWPILLAQRLVASINSVLATY